WPARSDLQGRAWTFARARTCGKPATRGCPGTWPRGCCPRIGAT
ncbi:MAG: hypothetical protein AVDCRST_MAG48-1440, partial [uncultured Friedmanniella sp.]